MVGKYIREAAQGVTAQFRNLESMSDAEVTSALKQLQYLRSQGDKGDKGDKGDDE